MYNIKIAPAAMEELTAIVRHIARDLHNPAAAQGLLDRIETCYTRLETSPYLYELCRDPQLKLRGYRRVILKNYIMFYAVDEEHNTVHILHFVYGPRDYSKLI